MAALFVWFLNCILLYFHEKIIDFRGYLWSSISFAKFAISRLVKPGWLITSSAPIKCHIRSIMTLSLMEASTCVPIAAKSVGLLAIMVITKLVVIPHVSERRSTGQCMLDMVRPVATQTKLRQNQLLTIHTIAKYVVKAQRICRCWIGIWKNITLM